MTSERPGEEVLSGCLLYCTDYGRIHCRLLHNAHCTSLVLQLVTYPLSSPVKAEGSPVVLSSLNSVMNIYWLRAVISEGHLVPPGPGDQVQWCL